MKQVIATLILVLVSAGLLAVVITGSQNRKDAEVVENPTSEKTAGASSQDSSNDLVFFYGITCPHCADVEKWMTENGIEERVAIIKKEVYEDRANALELAKVAESCGMNTNSIGVPFLHTPEGECFIGSVDIINYLSDKVDLNGADEATESGKEIE